MTDSRDAFDDWLNQQPAEPLSPPPGAFDRIARSARRRRWAKAAGTGAVVLALVTGLASVTRAVGFPDSGVATQPTATQPTATQPTTTTAGPSVPASTQPTATQPTATQPTAGQPSNDGRCASGQLRVSVVAGSNAAGHVGLVVVFTNISARVCTMFGYPGVSFVTGPSGVQVNDAAQRSSGLGAPVLVRVAAGGVAHASLLLVNVGNFGAGVCQPVLVAGVRVYPPDETVALFASSPQQVCSVNGVGVAQVYPVQTGA